jgi:hypothetical protein
MELNSSAAIWSDETRTQLLENVCSITMLTEAPPIWCIADTSPNEWTIIQNSIRGTISKGSYVTNLQGGRSTVKHPLAIAAMDVERPMQYSNGKTTNARKYALVPIIVVLTLVVVLYGTRFINDNTTKVESRDHAGRGSSNVLLDIDSTCLQAELLESSGVEIVSSRKDNINTDKRIDPPQTNESATFSEWFSDIEREDTAQEMMVPSTAALTYGVAEGDDWEDTESMRDDVEIKKVKEVFTISTEPSISREYGLTPLSPDIECIFEQNVMEYLELQSSKVDRRIRALLSSSVAQRARQYLESRIEKATMIWNILMDGIREDPVSDVESAFEQNILNFVQQRSLKLEKRLQVIVTLPVLNQAFVVQTMKLVSILHSQLRTYTTTTAVHLVSMSKAHFEKMIHLFGQLVSLLQYMKEQMATKLNVEVPVRIFSS